MKTKLSEILKRAEQAHREATHAVGIGARITEALAKARGEFRRVRSDTALAELIKTRSQAEAIAKELGDEDEFIRSARLEILESPEAFEALAASIDARAADIRKQVGELRSLYAQELATAALGIGTDPLDSVERPHSVTVARTALTEAESRLRETEYAARRAASRAAGAGSENDTFDKLLPFTE